EALDKLGRRSPIGSRLSSSEWADVPVALRERAFFSSRVESARFLQRASDAIADFLLGKRITLPNGQTVLATGGRAQFIEQMREFALREGMGALDPKHKGGLQDITSERRLGLIFDVQTRQAQDFAYRKQGLFPEVLNEFPAQRFIRVLYVKEPRDYHVPFEDQVFLKTDPIWRVINADFNVPWGPWGWGCGHDVEDVDRDEADSLGLTQPGAPVQPPAPEDFNDNLQASTRGLAPELIDRLKAEFGDRIVIEGETIRWAKPARRRAGGTAGTPGTNVPAAPAPVQTPAPVPAPAPATPAAPVRKSPVSAGLDIKVRGELKKKVLIGLDAINKVHDDGMLPKIPLHGRTSPGSLGVHRATRNTLTGEVRSYDIGVKADGPWPALTTVHECGHFLDCEGIGPKGIYATRAGQPDMLAVLAAAEKTAAIQGLKAELARGHRRAAELLTPEEIWARAYAQFIAMKSGDKTLLTDVANVRNAHLNRQWGEADFAPIAAAIENMFRNLGWL
ncbi:MAG TPA: hypothetical protein PK157_22870, partial [Bryobacteraceae bacterium]|nr:hypothetical protein [Bryobacteraceae bacterium]